MKIRLFLLIFSVLICCIGFKSERLYPTKNSTPASDSTALKNHVNELCKENKFRNWRSISELNRAGNYIFSEFKKHSTRVEKQIFEDKRNEYFNVICSFGPEDAPRLVIGAHYDVCGEQQGADDNASGVSSILELARMISQIESSLKYRIDLVAYTLEEPPFFRDFMMGSAVHARYLKSIDADVLGMISVEMIGYYSEEKRSQDYPIGLLKLFYPGKANYISVVTKFGNGRFLRQIKKGLKTQKKRVKVRSIKAPASVPGIDFSDHMNYWNAGFDAAMITDTSFYRNKNYHESTDIPETLNYKKMAAVTDGIFMFLLQRMVYFIP